MPREQQKRQLRRVTYEVTGRDGGRLISESGDVLSLLLHCPFFFIARIIPPMSVVNPFLTSAAADQSMSGGNCRWELFQLDDVEYRDLVNVLTRQRFKSVVTPRWVRTHRDWLTWCGEIVWGVPVAKARRTAKRIAALEQQMEASDGSDEQVVNLLKRLMALRCEEARYFSENCSGKPKMPLLRVR